jgi:hypothetical protein
MTIHDLISLHVKVNTVNTLHVEEILNLLDSIRKFIGVCNLDKVHQ